MKAVQMVAYHHKQKQLKSLQSSVRYLLVIFRAVELLLIKASPAVVNTTTLMHDLLSTVCCDIVVRCALLFTRCRFVCCCTVKCKAVRRCDQSLSHAKHKSFTLTAISLPK
jgi:hypothetical protein